MAFIAVIITSPVVSYVCMQCVIHDPKQESFEAVFKEGGCAKACDADGKAMLLALVAANGMMDCRYTTNTLTEDCFGKRRSVT